MTLPSHARDNRATAANLAEITVEFEKFEIYLGALAKNPMIKALVTEDARSRDSAGKKRNVAQIALDDALDTYENIMVEQVKNNRDFDFGKAPIELYTKLLRARQGKQLPGLLGKMPTDATGKDDFPGKDEDVALKTLKERVAAKLADANHTQKPFPLFLEILMDGVPQDMLNAMLARWSTLSIAFRHMMMTEEALVARNHMLKLKEKFVEAVGTWAEDAEDDLEQNVLASGGKNKKALKTDKELQVLLEAFGADLTELARDNANTPVLERENEVNGVLTSLSCDLNPFALVSGKPGSGKSSVVQGLAQRIASNNVPDEFKDGIVVRLKLRDMMSRSGQSQKKDELTGAPMAYDMFSHRLNTILRKAAEHNRKGGTQIILSIDETQDIYDGGILSPLREVGPILAAAVDNIKGLRLIVEASEAVKSTMMNKAASTTSKMTFVNVEPMKAGDTAALLRNEADRLRFKKKIEISDEMLALVVKLAGRYNFGGQSQPSSSISLLHRAAANASVLGAATLDVMHVATVLSAQTGVPAEMLSKKDSERIEALKTKLPERVLDQPEIMKIVDKLENAAKGMNDPNKPMASFMMIGPTGVGKTETGEALSDLLGMGRPIRIDMSNFMEKHSVTRLIGAPPSYAGYGDPSELQEIAKRPFSVVIVDEIEKAHPDVQNIFLSILDKGEVKMGNNTMVDCRNTIFLFTSNVGAKDAAHKASQGVMGFAAASTTGPAGDVKKETMMAALKQKFSPEFLGRFDDILYYNSLSDRVAEKICRMKVDKVSAMLRDLNNNLKLVVTDEAVKDLTTEGYKPESGARSMDKAIENLLKTPLRKWFNQAGAANIATPHKAVITHVGDEFGYYDEATQESIDGPLLVPVNDNGGASQKAPVAVPVPA